MEQNYDRSSFDRCGAQCFGQRDQRPGADEHNRTEQKQLREEVLMNLGPQKFPADLSKGCARKNFHCVDYDEEKRRSRYEP
jgi:hypothetical protein